MLLWLWAAGGGPNRKPSVVYLLILEAAIDALLDSLVENRMSGRRLPGR